MGDSGLINVDQCTASNDGNEQRMRLNKRRRDDSANIADKGAARKSGKKGCPIPRCNVGNSKFHEHLLQTIFKSYSDVLAP